MWDVTGLFDFTAWFICCICQGICTWQVNCSFGFFFMFSRSMTSKLCWKILARRESVWRGKEKKKKRDRKDWEGWKWAEIPVSKIPKECASPFLFSWESMVRWAPCRRQPVRRVAVWMTGGTTEEQPCLRPALPAAGKCYILEGSVLLQQKSTRIASCCVSLVLCCTSKYVSPLLTHMAVRKEICLKDLWLASYPHPAAAAMSFWRKTGSCHLLLYQLLSTGTIYSLWNIEVWPLLYNGDCNASAEMLVHWGSATDSESGPWDKQ